MGAPRRARDQYRYAGLCLAGCTVLPARCNPPCLRDFSWWRSLAYCRWRDPARRHGAVGNVAEHAWNMRDAANRPPGEHGACHTCNAMVTTQQCVRAATAIAPFANKAEPGNSVSGPGLNSGSARVPSPASVSQSAVSISAHGQNAAARANAAHAPGARISPASSSTIHDADRPAQSAAAATMRAGPPPGSLPRGARPAGGQGGIRPGENGDLGVPRGRILPRRLVGRTFEQGDPRGVRGHLPGACGRLADQRAHPAQDTPRRAPHCGGQQPGAVPGQQQRRAATRKHRQAAVHAPGPVAARRGAGRSKLRGRRAEKFDHQVTRLGRDMHQRRARGAVAVAAQRPEEHLAHHLAARPVRKAQLGPPRPRSGVPPASLTGIGQAQAQRAPGTRSTRRQGRGQVRAMLGRRAGQRQAMGSCGHQTPPPRPAACVKSPCSWRCTHRCA